MNFRWFSGSFAGALGAAALLLGLSSAPASAAIQICDADTAAYVAPLLGGVPTALDNGCQFDLTVLNDPTSEPLVVNTVGGTGFFGINSWIFDFRHNFEDDEPELEGPNDLGFALGAGSNETEGTFTLSNLAIADKVLLVFKGGDPMLPNALIAYLLDVVELGAGTYETMFYMIQPGGPKAGQPNFTDISHVGTYFTNSLTPGQTGVIPLPAAVWLMFAGIGGLGLISRRKAKAA